MRILGPFWAEGGRQIWDSWGVGKAKREACLFAPREKRDQPKYASVRRTEADSLRTEGAAISGCRSIGLGGQFGATFGAEIGAKEWVPREHRSATGVAELRVADVQVADHGDGRNHDDIEKWLAPGTHQRREGKEEDADEDYERREYFAFQGRVSVEKEERPRGEAEYDPDSEEDRKDAFGR
jgi:hypothetical protein